jgi:hypothetical protein
VPLSDFKEPWARDSLLLTSGHRIAELSGAIRQFQQSGLDNTTARLLLARNRAELEALMKAQSIGKHQK